MKILIHFFCNFEQIINSMDLQTRKLELIRIFLNIQNEDIINRVENLLKKENKVSKEKPLKQLTINELNNRIDKSLDDSKKDNVTEIDDLIEEIEKWN